jgi:hypothetical protein
MKTRIGRRSIEVHFFRFRNMRGSVTYLWNGLFEYAIDAGYDYFYQVWSFVCTHVYARVCVCIHLHMYMHVCVCVYMFSCVYARVCMCLYTRVYIPE